MIKNSKKSFKKDNNLFLNNYSYSKKKCFLFLFIVIIFILFLNLTSFSVKIKNYFYSVSKPIQEWIWDKGFSSSKTFQGFIDGHQLKNQNELLLKRNRELVSQNVELENLKEENEKFRKLLGLDLKEEFDFEMAQVISRDFSNNFITINKGAHDDLKVNYPIITEEKVLVGKIVEVYEEVSKIRLLKSKESLINVEVFNQEIEGLLKGGKESDYVFDFIPESSEISKGSLVITSNLGNSFPEGFLIGNIKDVQKSEQPSFKKATVEPLYDFKSLDEVFIVLQSSF